jgi:hypothetical protein
LIANLLDVKKGISNNVGKGLTRRLALGAKLSASLPSTQFQNRMNRKMGIPSVIGSSKVDKMKNGQNGSENGNGKRKADVDSDSEEDSKSRLITKSSLKKHQSDESINKKKKISKESAPHKAITTGEHPALSPSNSPKRETNQKLLLTENGSSTKSDRSKSPITTAAEETELPVTLERSVSPPTSKVLRKVPDLPKLSEIREEAAKTKLKATEETPEEEKKRLKKERKKERKRLKRLEKKNSQMEEEN